MKLDVMDGFKEVGMVVGYRDGNGGTIDALPSCASDWDQVQPVVKMFKGWAGATRGITQPKDLPGEARDYLAALCGEVETPLAYLSTGPDRSEGFVPRGSILESVLG